MNQAQEKDIIEAMDKSGLDTGHDSRDGNEPPGSSEAELSILEDGDIDDPTKPAQEVEPEHLGGEVDLSNLRGVASHSKIADVNSTTELEGLAELVPDLKSRKHSEDIVTGGKMTAETVAMPRVPSATPVPNDGEVEVIDGIESSPSPVESDRPDESGRMKSTEPSPAQQQLPVDAGPGMITRSESMMAQQSNDIDDISKTMPHSSSRRNQLIGGDPNNAGDGDGGEGPHFSPGISQNIPEEDETFDHYPDSEGGLVDEAAQEATKDATDATKVPKEFMNSGNSISTATQTHEVRMPMYLPTFKPATGCTNASDFIVRCFIARLRSGITVVKHARSRWCKSRLRVLHIHPDGRSLSWKPAEGEPNSGKRPPKLDLTTCLEVRHAWSPDPQNPMYTGTPILRQKCEAANAHKSFALIFKQRTVDITAVTADQCKVLMEGFSALCFRLQVASLAGRSGSKKGQARPMPEEDGVSTTASVTLTNTSTPRGTR